MSASGRYLLGDSPAEIRHLVEQEEVYAREANELFDLVGLAAGTAAIDVGCGVMGALHLLAGRVGPGGRAVGLTENSGWWSSAETLRSNVGGGRVHRC